MKKLKTTQTLKKVAIVLAIIGLLGACKSWKDDLSSSKDTVPSKIVMNSPKSVVFSKDDGKLLSVAQNGTTSLVKFINQSGEEIEISIESCVVLSPSYIGFQYKYKVYIVDINSTKIYLIGDYVDLESALVVDNYLFIASYDKQLNKINLTTLVSTPVNNPQYDPVYVTNGSIKNPILVDKNLNPLANVFDNNTSRKIFPSDGSSPVIANNVQKLVDDYDGFQLLKGQDGLYYSFSNPMGMSQAVAINKYTITKTALLEERVFTDTNNTYHNYIACTSLSKNSTSKFYAVYKNGFYRFTPITNGGYNAVFTAKTMPTALTISNTKVSQDGYAFYLENNTIKTMNLETETSFRDLVTNYQINKWWIVGNNVFFTAYETATTIHTYMVGQTGAPVKVKTSEMQVGTIIEL